MKLTSFLFFMSILHVWGANSYSQKVRLNLNIKNVTTASVLNSIENQSEFFFLYSPEIVDVNRKVSITSKKEKIDQVLNQLFAGTDIIYVIKDRQIVLTTKKLINPFIGIKQMQQQQQRKITGTVTGKDGASLPGVNVVVTGTILGTTTDINGKYNINVPQGSKSLSFTFVGMTPQKIIIGTLTQINVTMIESSIGLRELVVVAFGTVRKEDLTGSVSTINSKLLSSESTSTVSKALEGNVPGLQISSIDGQPGLDNGIRIRGLGTASQNNSNALIVIDGVPSSQPNILSIINPKDIASMTILKDASSTALWGSRGANGVILVTTKKGKAGQPKITYESRYGINQQGGSKYKKISNPKDYYEYAWLSIYNAARFKSPTKYSTNVQTPNMSNADAALFASQHLFDYVGSTTAFQRNGLGNWMLYDVPGATYTPTGSGSNASSTMGGSYLVGIDGKLNPNAKLLYNDSYDNYFLENKFRQEQNLTISGASKTVDYFTSLGYLQDPSYIMGSKFVRYNLRSNVDAKVTKWLTVGVKTAYAHRATQSPATRWGRNPGSAVANVFRWSNGQNQLVPLWAHNLDGTYQLDENGNKIVNSAADMTPSPLGPTSGPLVPYDLTYIMGHDKDETVSNDLNLLGYIDIRFLTYFTFNANLSYNNSFNMRTRYWNPVTGSATGYDGALGKNYSKISTLNTQQVLKWARDFGKQHVNIIIGHEFNSYNYSSLNYKGAYSLIPDLEAFRNFVGLNTGSTFAGTGGGENKTALEGYFARTRYTFGNKYYAQVSIRRDGSSKFRYNNNRWGTFWAIGGGWRISSENFMSAAKSWLNDLKIRGSYGIVGNQNGVSNYSGYQTWRLGVSSYNYHGASYYPAGYTLKQGNFVNSDLTWEKVYSTDLGMDFRLFDRFDATLDYYVRNTHGMIWSQPIAYSLGQSAIIENNARLRSKGFEFNLSVDIIKTQDAQWSVSINGTHYRTTIVSVPAGTGSKELNGDWTAGTDRWSMAGTGSSPVSYLRGVGKDYYNMYLYKYAGVDQKTGLPLFFHKVTQADLDAGLYTNTKVGGDIKTVNYSQASRYEFGSATPDIIGGFNTSFRYKNFDLSVAFAFQLGGLFMSHEYGDALYHSERIDHALSSELIGNTWTPENTDAKFPMQMYTGDQYVNGATIGSWKYTSMDLFSASYLSVKNITIGYTLPQRLVKKIHLSSVRVYASADNMWLLTHHGGFDPRMSLAGGYDVGAYTYPYMRTKSLGIKVTF